MKLNLLTFHIYVYVKNLCMKKPTLADHHHLLFLSLSLKEYVCERSLLLPKPPLLCEEEEEKEDDNKILEIISSTMAICFCNFSIFSPFLLHYYYKMHAHKFFASLIHFLRSSKSHLEEEEEEKMTSSSLPLHLCSSSMESFSCFLQTIIKNSSALLLLPFLLLLL